MTTTTNTIADNLRRAIEHDTEWQIPELWAKIRSYENIDHLSRLNELVQDLASVRTELAVYSECAAAIEHDETGRSQGEIAHAVAVGHLRRSMDDTWSGRGNDFKRVVFDARRRACERLLTWCEIHS